MRTKKIEPMSEHEDIGSSWKGWLLLPAARNRHFALGGVSLAYVQYWCGPCRQTDAAQCMRAILRVVEFHRQDGRVWTKFCRGNCPHYRLFRVVVVSQCHDALIRIEPHIITSCWISFAVIFKVEGNVDRHLGQRKGGTGTSQSGCKNEHPRHRSHGVSSLRTQHYEFPKTPVVKLPSSSCQIWKDVLDGQSGYIGEETIAGKDVSPNLIHRKHGWRNLRRAGVFA